MRHHSQSSFPFIRYCVDNKVFAHTLLIIISIVGIVGIFSIQTQLIPNLTIPQVYTQFTLPGASAQQIESSIINPAENSIDGMNGLDTMTSISRLSNATLVLSFFQGQDLIEARNDVAQALDATDFPENLEKWQTKVVEPKEQVARLLIKGISPFKLKPFIQGIRSQLKSRGIYSVSSTGDADLELVLEVNPRWLLTQNRDLHQLSQSIKRMLIELPTGFLGESGEYSSSEIGTPIKDVIQLDWSLISPKDFAQKASHIFQQIYFQPSEKSSRLFSSGEAVAELRIFRAENQDLLTVANSLKEWFNEYDATGHSVEVYDETWSYFYDRLFLLGKNGLAGLILIAFLLSYFLNKRTAFWVGAGIPIAILGTLAVIYPLGFQINMISLFAMILSLGIIVDDAIVVGERHTTLSQFMSSANAAKQAACEMVRPIMTSSLTTLAAFFPLLFISGVTGQFLREIPVVVITVIVASLIECFFILPKHLSSVPSPKKVITKSKRKFRYFKIYYFLPAIKQAIHNKAIIFTLAASFVFLTISLVTTGHIKFSFFPSYTSDRITIEVDFVSKATFDEKRAFLTELETYSLQKINNIDPTVLRQSYVAMNERLSERYDPNPINNGIQIWLTDQDNRDTSNQTLIDALNLSPPQSNLVNQLIIDQPRGGPPADTIQIEMIGTSLELSKAVDALKEKLKGFAGVFNIADDISTFIPNHYFQLHDTMLFTGIDNQNLYSQVSSYLSDSKQLTLAYEDEELDITVKLPDDSTAIKHQLFNLPISLPNGSHLPLGEITSQSTEYVPQQLIKKDRNRTATVSAKVNSSITNTYAIESLLAKEVIPEIEAKYAVITGFGKIKQDQSKIIQELKNGAIIGIFSIFLIMTWSTNSFIVPFAILFTIPLSLMGGILGHWILGFDITLLSLFGFFGLMGVTVNDSIILTLYFQNLRKRLPLKNALIQASSDRLRAVMLTSLTTIGGLLPLMFETSFQAQFLIPRAITIAFGLLFGTVWILLFLPAMLSLIGSYHGQNS
ncbi:MAG: efflux RND transporter permease subunit [Pseudomonadota bacterium]|nr:efflux RND transporter permease subunit [Pseudomonadota bacterium]